MRKLLIPFLIITMLTHNGYLSSSMDELPQIINATKDLDLELEQWQTVIIDDLSTQQANEYINMLKDSHFITVNTDKNALIYIVEGKNPTINKLTYTIQLIIPTNSHMATRQITLKATSWNNQIYEQYFQQKTSLLLQNKKESKRIFTCLTFTQNGIMNVDFLIDDLGKKLKMIHKNIEHDTIHQSSYRYTIYGFTPKWNNTLELGNERINFQLAVKNINKDERKIIIGTPLILNEY